MPAEDGKVRRIGPHVVVAMPAEIDAANASRISQGLLSAVSLGAAVVIIDMSGTTFCDSAGVQAIIAAHRQAAADGTQLRLVATAVLRILTLLGIGQLIPLYPTLDAALAGTPPAQAGTADRRDEPGGTTASGDPQAHDASRPGA
jgi:anti-sigma B factor antagonist